MDVVVTGRRCEVTDRFRETVEDKLSRLDKLDQRVIRVEVEVSKEANPRLADRAERVQLTVHSKGPVVRAEAAAPDRLTALDRALDKLQARLRRAASRRRVHYGGHRPVSLAEAAAAGPAGPLGGPGGATTALTLEAEPAAEGAAADTTAPTETGGIAVDGEGPMVVREKWHEAAPMTLDHALYQMELVGHDFYLFVDKASGLPAVVYRRQGYDYGVIRLVTKHAENGSSPGGEPSGQVAASGAGGAGGS